MATHPLTDFLARLVRRENLSRDEAFELLEALLDAEATDAQISGALVALASKGETVEELTGLAEGLRSRAVRLVSKHPCFIDTAGTGSSCAKTFNISTAAAFVIAGAGLPVAKHGNRAASSKCGSADLLTALGVNVSAIPLASENALNEINICFMFAPLFHGATARVAGIRRQLGIHTTFNLLGPLSNPAGAPRQIIGVFRKDLAEKLAQVLAALGTERAWVVHGEDGLDEITLAGKTFVAEAQGGEVKTFEIGPSDSAKDVVLSASFVDTPIPVVVTPPPTQAPTTQVLGEHVTKTPATLPLTGQPLGRVALEALALILCGFVMTFAYRQPAPERYRRRH